MENIVIIVLLFVIATSELARLFLTHRPETRKNHFKKKLEGTKKMIADLEFKIFKTREIREDIRQEYAYMVSRIESIDNQINKFPADGNQDELGRLKDDKVRAERDRDRFVAQMKQLDVEIGGAKPSQDYPDGVEGITQQIDSLQELSSMLKDWIKTL